MRRETKWPKSLMPSASEVSHGGVRRFETVETLDYSPRMPLASMTFFHLARSRWMAVFISSLLPPSGW